MSNFHRLIWIDSQIRAGQYPNCKTIAARFEISPRQAARDVEYLRDTMGAPLEYAAARRGYYYLEPAYVLPGNFLSEREERTLSSLALQYQNAGSAQAMEIAVLFQRLSREAGGPPSMARADFVANMPVRVREPYQAIIAFPDTGDCTGVTARLRFPCRKVGEGRYQISFFESTELLAALWALPDAFRVIAPQWLKERLRDKLNLLVRFND